MNVQVTLVICIKRVPMKSVDLDVIVNQDLHLILKLKHVLVCYFIKYVKLYIKQNYNIQYFVYV